MCGLVGFWDWQGYFSAEQGLQTVQKMADAIQHRGPDAHGVWAEERSGLFLAHRRLSIIDLSETGHQPMLSNSGKFAIVYNGEVFNFVEIREQLKLAGVKFKGNSDTEVILEACEHWGVLNTCQKLIGMFAFALWDRQKRLIYLVRDRLGIKPLYWGIQKNTLFFGSQPKAFSKHPFWAPKLNQEALIPYFRFNYIPAPLSIFEGIHKLCPATILTIDENRHVQEIRFWDLEKIVIEKKQQRNEFQSDADTIQQLTSLLEDAVKRRMIADVPLGAFLSGGIDSSTVVALMQAQSMQPVKTFSIGFNEAGFNEATYAASVAKHLNTEHHELYVESQQAQNVIPDVPSWYDEPFADVSQIPTFLVSRLARQQVKVALSGDGGDELFAGYSRYLFGQSIWQKLGIFPGWARQMLGRGLRHVPVQYWEGVAKTIPKRFRPAQFSHKISKLAEVLSVDSAAEFYKSLVSQWGDPTSLVLQGKEPILYPWLHSQTAVNLNFVEHMQFMDTATYLPDDILVKVDRASMAVGLEARVPLLDHRLVEFAWSLPIEMKIRHGKGKWLLRQVLNRYVPNQLIERPKMGFGVPIDQWLRGSLKEWAAHLLDEKRIETEGILNGKWIGKRWKEHLSGERNWQYGLWGVLMFQAWKEKWKVS